MGCRSLFVSWLILSAMRCVAGQGGPALLFPHERWPAGTAVDKISHVQQILDCVNAQLPAVRVQCPEIEEEILRVVEVHASRMRAWPGPSKRQLTGVDLGLLVLADCHWCPTSAPGVTSAAPAWTLVSLIHEGAHLGQPTPVLLPPQPNETAALKQQRHFVNHVAQMRRFEAEVDAFCAELRAWECLSVLCPTAGLGVDAQGNLLTICDYLVARKHDLERYAVEFQTRFDHAWEAGFLGSPEQFLTQGQSVAGLPEALAYYRRIDPTGASPIDPFAAVVAKFAALAMSLNCPASGREIACR